MTSPAPIPHAPGATSSPPGLPTPTPVLPLRGGHGFGTGPVFLASICTILGAIMFLRFGYAVGHTGLLGALAIILLGHAVTVPTALAISEIATNRRVEGGGEYFIISRSFGTTIGGAIGISLYLSQAISVAFYMIAFAEAFRPLQPWFESVLGGFDPRLISLPATLALAGLVLTRGANLGVKALWVVAGVLGISLVLFFLGGPPEGAETGSVPLFSALDQPHSFMLVFAICFPAFTGMTAGVGLSGDLANPRKSIPMGIMAATLVGMLVYVALVVKLAVSATPEMLADDQLVMSRIALWGPIIPIGLACATVSSALGSILVAPRTLQALGGDRIAPSDGVNGFLAMGRGRENEPRNATLLTAVIALVTVALGSVDLVARIVSMFFMVTYGALCAISFLEHFAARPSYRPSFRSKWYLSLFGAVMCFLLMLQMDPIYAVLAIVMMGVLYGVILKTRPQGEEDDLAAIFQGVMAQATRYLQINLQKRGAVDWRPSVLMISGRTFERGAPLQFLVWLCQRYGFGTYFHFIQGRLNTGTFRLSREILGQLIEDVGVKRSAVYVDTMISPSMQSALAQTLQVPGVSGMENNSIIFEFSIHDPAEELEELLRGCRLAAVPAMNRMVLRHGDHFFGNRRHVHIWLTWHDYRNANLMILLAYILLGHPDWEDGEINIYAAYPTSEVRERTAELHTMILEGRLPISPKNVEIIATDAQVDFQSMVESRSAAADLVILGFTDARLLEKGQELFRRHAALRDVLWVAAEEEIFIE